MDSKAIIIGFIFLCSVAAEVGAQPNQTNLCIENKTQKMAYMSVRGIVDSQWSGSDRPDINFNGIGISPGSTYCRLETSPRYTDQNKTPYFEFVVNGTEYSKLRLVRGIFYKWAVDDLSGPIYPTEKDGPKTIPNFQDPLSGKIWYMGKRCNSGYSCTKLFIR